ncbi:MarR family transcriptional regulator [Amnibacterium endophyticum]|uniref:MarR family transcriptional regulator n=1 Tax=Amnibacterium endophyticum TaxID=2109337 RepID=A0ABW4LGP3_9MICO
MAEASERLAAEAARELRTTVGRLRRRLREVSNEGALSASQTSVLARLARGEADSAAALAAAEGVRPQSMAATLGALEERGLIARAADPADARRAVVRLTDAGHARWAGDRAARQEWLARTLDERLDADDLRCVLAATAVLDRVVRQR